MSNTKLSLAALLFATSACTDLPSPPDPAHAPAMDASLPDHDAASPPAPVDAAVPARDAAMSAPDAATPSLVLPHPVASADRAVRVIGGRIEGATVPFVSSEETSGEDAQGAHAVDGDRATLWHTTWSSADPEPPHYIVLDLGASVPVTRLVHVPRAVGTNGRIDAYRVFAYAAGTWTEWASGRIANVAVETTIDVPDRSTRYLAFVVDEAHVGPWATLGELIVQTSLADTSVAPSAPADERLTYLVVSTAGPYGTRTFDVPAVQSWVNSGLYLRRGQTAMITASGRWNVDGGALYGPDGHATETQRGCQQGELVARSGLVYGDTSLTCVGRSARFTAPRDGIVFLGAIVSTDLGESYATRLDAVGEVTVTVASEGDTVPMVSHGDAARFDFTKVRSGWVEIYSAHTILTVTATIAQRDRGTIARAGARLDAIYEKHRALRGDVPFHGERMRFFPDQDAPGYMLAGNPIRMDDDLHLGGDDTRITRAGEPGNSNWGFAHELGHEFTFVNGLWTYQVGGTLEGWPNVFSVYALESLGISNRRRASICEDRDAYLASGTQAELEDDPWLSLCFFLELQQAHGWGMYERFFRELNGTTASQIPSGGRRWTFIRDRMNRAANADTTAIFRRFHIALP